MVSFFDTFGLWNGHKISGGSLLLYISIMFYFLSQVKSKLRLFEPTRVNDSYLAPALWRRGVVVVGGRVGWKEFLREAWEKKG